MVVVVLALLDLLDLAMAVPAEASPFLFLLAVTGASTAAHAAWPIPHGWLSTRGPEP